MRSFLSLLVSACCAAAADVPQTRLTALDGSIISFPRPEGQRPLVLLLGFSHQSEKTVDTWNRRFQPSYLADRGAEYYELLDFEGVPSLIMRMILHGMRRAVPAEQRPHVAPFYSSEDDWKRLTGYTAPEDAYVILADAKGHVVWTAHGVVSEEKLSDLQARIAKLTSAPH